MANAVPETMRAAAIDHFGGVEAIHVETLDVPELGPDGIKGHDRSWLAVARFRTGHGTVDGRRVVLQLGSGTDHPVRYTRGGETL